MQDTINGYPIIMATDWRKQRMERPCRVILVDRGESQGHGRYVPTRQGADGETWEPEDQWVTGNYTCNLSEALDVFSNYCKLHFAIGKRRESL